jgi:hypothetical protein
LTDDGLVKRTIRTEANVLPFPPVTVRFHLRHTNALPWRLWLGDIDVADHHRRHLRVLIKNTIGQLFGGAGVAIAPACAATISYSTPTVGITSRSLNYL